MEDLLAARLQMAISLGFHIVFACIGMAMPFFVAVAHWRWLRCGEQVYYDLARAWTKGLAIFFATGAVSGTALSFELGLLWPTFMEHAGPIFGMPFSLEGAAFFIEAIALGFYLYGWGRLSPWVHWTSGLVVGIAGVASGVFVVAANGWMNAPSGFDWVNGQAENVDPLAAMLNDAFASQAIHMTLAAFAATGFAAGGLHALQLIRDRENLFHQKAMRIALGFGAVASLLQPLSGHFSATEVGKQQPAKLAAMEALFDTRTRAPLLIGGLPDERTREVHYALEIPGALSLLLYGDPDAEVVGLSDFPEEDWPPVAIVHVAFEVMVGIGGMLAGLSALFLAATFWRPRWLTSSLVLKLFALATPLGFIAVEAGWTATEVGRQPWIIYGIMRTADAVTPMPGVIVPLLLFTSVYVFLSAMAGWLLLRQMTAVKSLGYGSRAGEL